jgi:hydroxymethylbilane synthase
MPADNASSQPPLRLGTRGSALARWQAEWTAQRLRQTDLAVELIPIRTGGDVTSRPIADTGQRGLFTKEIQRALLQGHIDLAVHSLKDLPTEPVEGLELAAVPPREDCRDALVTLQAQSLERLPQAARVGTGSRRRQSQLLHQRPDLVVADIRGNVDTRLRKLDEGQYDAIILACAGLKRLDLEHRITEVLSPRVMLPAIGQGALGIEVRSSDGLARNAVMVLNDPQSKAAVLAERELLAQLRGGCLAPVGAWGHVVEGRLLLDAVVLSHDGQQRLEASAAGDPDQPEAIGQHVSELLRAQGAADLIAQARP